MTDWHRWDGRDLILTLRVQPRASRDGFAEILGDAVKLRVAAPPSDGRANAQLVGFLARAFGVSKRSVQIESGRSGRSKRVRICRPTRLPELAGTGVVWKSPGRQPGLL